MKINGKTQTCGLIGNPVEHTLSPVIHNHLAEWENRNLVYVPFLVEQDRIREAVEGANALHIHGLNVTVPHKSAVIPYLKEIDRLAENIGAVNTLVKTENGYKGYNTDMPGLLRAMETENYTIKGESIILLGAGGAARAVAMLCMEQGAKEIFLLNRSIEKAMAVAKEVNGIYQENKIIPMVLSDYGKLPDKKYLAIQATSVGLYPNVEDVVISEEAFYDKIEAAVDLIYNPYETKFMSMVKAHGGRAMNGLKMLLFQGIIAYELWNNVTVSEEMAEKILKKMKEELNIHE
ncbi:MAG: shikimate dehydrogenase [Roseburia sp.]|nr:shikimate dehydrogenase [Roseburia sp.]MCM1277829.1 shikimate dehydrogenase [Robinsoniella sp.]